MRLIKYSFCPQGALSGLRESKNITGRGMDLQEEALEGS